MIELRWFTKIRMIPGLPAMPEDYHVRVLQYRQFEDQGRVINAWNGKWTGSDWIDVPEIEEHDKE